VLLVRVGVLAPLHRTRSSYRAMDGPFRLLLRAASHAKSRHFLRKSVRRSRSAL